MARTQIEQMLEDELSKVTRELERATSDLHERISALEEQGERQTSGDGNGSSGEQSDEFELTPKTRRDIIDDMYHTQFEQKTNKGHPYVMEQNRPYMPLCRGCRHLTALYDGEIMQYNNESLDPFYTYSGFIVCDKVGHMPLRTGPKQHCTLMIPDGGDQPDLSKRPRPKPI